MIAKYCPEYSLSKPETLVAVSGAGNVAQFTALKIIELGGTVVSLSDSHGSLIATHGGVTKEDVEAIGALKLKGGQLHSITSSLKGKYEYHEGKRPWTLIQKLHIALPCATQNEVSEEEAHALIKAGAKIVAEGSNMGCTQEAVHVFEASRKQGGVRIFIVCQLARY
jgi:glutamate dehydrogenase (NADP+)